MVDVRRRIFDEEQGIDEEVIYGFVTTKWGTVPTSISVTVKTLPDMEIVTDEVFPVNETTVEGDEITLSPFKNLTAGVIYRIEVRFTVSEGSKFELFGIVRGEL